MRKSTVLCALIVSALLCAAGALGAAPSAHPPRAKPPFRGSTQAAALNLQYHLGDDVGLRNASFVGTHNSFNSTAEMGSTLSDTDSNQKIDLVSQLDAGLRALEIDVHYFPSLSGGGFAPVVCHARGADQGHAGCSIEKTLGLVLDEIGGWLRRPENRNEVLELYVEEHLDNEAGFAAAASVIREKLADILYAPDTGGGTGTTTSGPLPCTPLPLELTRDEIRAAHSQVFIVSDCGLGDWPGVAFDWSAHLEEQPRKFKDFPDCGPDFARNEYSTNLVRYYEDSTALSAATGGDADRITPETAGAMARCGVDLIGFDQFTGASDPRLAQVLWSWAPDQPALNRGACAVQRADKRSPTGRWFVRRCVIKRRPACRQFPDRWFVVKTKVPEKAARRICRRKNAAFAVPRNGYEAQLLRLAMKRSGSREVWLAYKVRKGAWVALDKR